eukprot:c14704_g1_i3.p2 GENE.c14704_g1_i3~~c14704_g1_i3.p2  ORF type:complete len:293 (-),score=52.85 c14704_g1_i3:85-963(-)
MTGLEHEQPNEPVSEAGQSPASGKGTPRRKSIKASRMSFGKAGLNARTGADDLQQLVKDASAANLGDMHAAEHDKTQLVGGSSRQDKGLTLDQVKEIEILCMHYVKARKAALGQQLQDLGNDKIKLEGQLRDAVNEKLQLENDKAQLQGQLRDAVNEKLQLENDKAQLQGQLRDAANETAQLENDKAQLQGQLCDAANETVQLENDKAQLQGQLDAAAKHITQLEARLHVAANEKAQLVQADKAQQIAELRRQLNEELVAKSTSSVIDRTAIVVASITLVIVSRLCMFLIRN